MYRKFKCTCSGKARLATTLLNVVEGMIKCIGTSKLDLKGRQDVARGFIPRLARVRAPLPTMKVGATNAVAVGDLI